MESPLQELIDQLSILPGVGPKSAQRLAFFLLELPQKEVLRFAEVMVRTRQSIKYCRVCYNISFEDLCHICRDEGRDRKRLCIVAEPKDILAIERTREYHGLYHVLGGVISPIEGIHPEALRIRELLDRLKRDPFSEIILAINPTIEGDTTVLYLTDLLKPFNAPLFRLAYGLPVGADMDYADDLTLLKAYTGRTRIQ